MLMNIIVCNSQLVRGDNNFVKFAFKREDEEKKIFET